MWAAPVGLIARELVTRCRELTSRIGQLERENTQIVSHVSTGMTLTVNYAAVWTPYTMCASGNVPE